MGELKDKFYEKAKEKYIHGEELEEIARELGISKRTLYTWKNKDNWDEDKEMAGLSPEKISELITFSIKKVVMRIRQNPDELMTPGVADSLVKYAAMINKLEKTADYLGTASDVMELITKTIKEEFPEEIEAWQKIARKVYQKIEEKWGK